MAIEVVLVLLQAGQVKVASATVLLMSKRNAKASEMRQCYTSPKRRYIILPRKWLRMRFLRAL